MQRPTNFKIGDRFKVIENGLFDAGEIITLKEDDGTNNPLFWDADKSNCYFRSFSFLEPYPKTIRDVQVGDELISSSGTRYLVFERGQRTLLLSCGNDFTNPGNHVTFEQLDRHFALKAEPEPVDDKTAEAIKLLEEAGYNIEKKNAQSSNCQAGGGGAGDSGAGGSGLC